MVACVWFLKGISIILTSVQDSSLKEEHFWKFIHSPRAQSGLGAGEDLTNSMHVLLYRL